jgi:demethylmenaquinone methyltransferase/2-methoxy-6-polyprenyl-1,4-benzoquinol methylase
LRNVSTEKNPERIGGMFNRIAPTYDFLNHFLSAGMDLWWRRQAVRALQLRPGDHVLDVASGTGDLAFAALKDEPNLQVVGVDFATRMLAQAETKRRQRGIGCDRYQVLAGDAMHLPFAPNRFDAAMIAYGIRNVPDMGAALAEFHRVLKPCGSLCILEFSLPGCALFRTLYLFYFQHILPALGQWVSRDREAYDYLPASVGAFQTPQQIAETLCRHGFQVKDVRPLLGGVTTCLLAARAG